MKTNNKVKQITKESVKAFLNSSEFSKSNMSVENEPNVTILKYYDKPIAYKYNDRKGTVTITNKGYFTNLFETYDFKPIVFSHGDNTTLVFNIDTLYEDLPTIIEMVCKENKVINL